jgi:trans-2,3-dihydro-3-hydroxyanthranilate isomerase
MRKNSGRPLLFQGSRRIALRTPGEYTYTMSNPPRRFRFVQLDVFTSTPLEGNQLAVFPDARGLRADQMQALAREMNLSETTFIIPREMSVEREHGVQVRIFTVEEELPFAGHPTLGTAMVVRGQSGAERVLLDLQVGPIPVHFRDSDGIAFGEMRQRDPEFGRRHAPEDVARASGLHLEDIDAGLPIQSVSTGLDFTIVPVRTLAAVQNLRLNWAQASEYLERAGARFFYFVTRETVNPESRLHARMIFYNGEDPATGSAAGCAAAWMVAHGVARPEETAIIEQGLECKRPSRIVVRASREDDRVVNVRVGGNAVVVMEGDVLL